MHGLGRRTSTRPVHGVAHEAGRMMGSPGLVNRLQTKTNGSAPINSPYWRSS